MTTFQFHVQTGENGSIVIPTTPFEPGTNVTVIVRRIEKSEMAVDDFIEFCKNKSPSDIADSENVMSQD